MAYLTPEQYIAMYDERRVRQLLSDSGFPVTGDLASDTHLEQIIAEASEMIAAAVLVGKRYTLEELDELAASTDFGFLLRRLTGDLTYGLIVARRGTGAADLTRLAPMYSEALRMLEMLRLGHHIFPGLTNDDHPDAGLPGTGDLDSPTNPNRLIKFTNTAARLFPSSCRRTGEQECC